VAASLAREPSQHLEILARVAAGCGLDLGVARLCAIEKGASPELNLDDHTLARTLHSNADLLHAVSCNKNSSGIS